MKSRAPEEERAMIERFAQVAWPLIADGHVQL